MQDDIEKKLRELLLRYNNGEVTNAEKLFVEKWYDAISKGESIPEAEIDKLALMQGSWQSLKELESKLNPIRLRKLGSSQLFRVAASILVLLTISGSAYWMVTRFQINNSKEILTHDIAPGSSKAVLTLSNGKKITLDDASQGEDIVKTQGLTIKKTTPGSVVYKSDEILSSAAAEEVNTISTPLGGQFEIVLQDGTKVWLNAGSTLTFPATFAGKTSRKVKLTGQAYFEVAKNSSIPFSVQSTEQLVTVTGTHFDVSCYFNEPLKTTLAEGSVIVSQPKTGKKQNLTPGQQSTITNNDGIQIKNVNPADYIAWKDNEFVFVSTPIEQVLSSIGRWYNVDIDYSQIHRESFDGRISRRIPLSQVLHALEKSMDMKFEVKGRRIKVIQ